LAPITVLLALAATTVATPVATASAAEECNATSSTSAGALQDFRDRLRFLSANIEANPPKSIVFQGVGQGFGVLTGLFDTRFEDRLTDSPELTEELSAKISVKVGDLQLALQVHGIATATQQWTDLLNQGKPVDYDVATRAKLRALVGKPKLRWVHGPKSDSSGGASTATLLTGAISSVVDYSRQGLQKTPFEQLDLTPTGVICTTGTGGSQIFRVTANMVNVDHSQDILDDRGAIVAELTFDANGRLTGAFTSATLLDIEGQLTKYSNGSSTFRYVPVTIKLPTPDTYISQSVLDRAVASLKVRATTDDAAKTVIRVANADGRATPAEVRAAARRLCAPAAGKPAKCTVTSISAGAHMSAPDPYTGGRYAVDVVVEKGKAVRK